MQVGQRRASHGFNRIFKPLRRLVIASAMACAGLQLVSVVDVPAHARNKRAEAARSDVETGGKPVSVQVRTISSFSRTNPFSSRFGKLEFLGGMVLSSDERGFGGWSDIAIDSDGQRALMISDDGHWLTTRFIYKDGRLSGLETSRMGPLRARSGRVLDAKKESDAEGLALVSGTLAKGEVLISFERIHRIGRFRIGPDGLEGPFSYLSLPAEVSRLKKNSGIEAIAHIKSGPNAGAIAIFAERRRKRDGEGAGRPGWLIQGGRVTPFSVADHGGLDISGAVGLPDGSIVIIERHFSWSTGLNVRLRRIQQGAIKAGTVLDGDVLLEADLSNEIDNLEGVTAHVGADGRTVLTLVSDDNFRTLLQRTLILQFAILP